MICCDEDTEPQKSDTLPPKPEEPLPSDCCGSGCSPCVFEIYERDLKDWQKKCTELKNGDNTSNYIDQDGEIHVLATTKFTELCLEEICRVNKDTCIYRFNLDRNQSLGFTAGQHLVLRYQ